MKITARQIEVLRYIEENGHAPFNANAGLRNRMSTTLGLYESVRGEDGTWTDVLTEEGRAALA